MIKINPEADEISSEDLQAASDKIDELNKEIRPMKPVQKSAEEMAAIKGLENWEQRCDGSFKELTADEEKEFRADARKIYEASQPIPITWHPVFRDECEKIRRQEIRKMKEKRRAEYVAHRYEYAVEHAQEWAENVAVVMESKVREIREYSERFNDDEKVKPEDLMGWVLNNINNLVSCFHVEDVPRYAAKIAEARALKDNKLSF